MESEPHHSSNLSPPRLYSLVAPSHLVAGAPLLATVHLLREVSTGGRTIVTARLMRGDNSLASTSRDLRPHAPVTLELQVRPGRPRSDLLPQVPGHLQGHGYRLQVEAVELSLLEGHLFSHSVALAIHRPRQVATIRLDQGLFLRGQQVQLLVNVAQTDLTPYLGPVSVELLAPGGPVLRQWSYRGLPGPRLLSYPLAARTPVGRWSIRVKAGDATAATNFHVLDWRPARVEVVVEAPRELELVPGLQQISATITATCSQSGLEVQGSLGLTATLLSTRTRQQVARLTVSQPEWAGLNYRGSYDYSQEEVQRAR